jgi:hypothetical protein
MHLLPKHYWRKQLREEAPERFAAVACDTKATSAMLSLEPQRALSWFSRWLAFLTTPFKRFGISGWKETGCGARASGRPVRGAQHSTDGFWTVDVALEELAIGTMPVDLSVPRYLRLEVEPNTAAHEVCAGNAIEPSAELAFGGAVVIDTDGPFLEVHPEENFRIVR